MLAEDDADEVATVRFAFTSKVDEQRFVRRRLEKAGRMRDLFMSGLSAQVALSLGRYACNGDFKFEGRLH